jgi:nucleoside 2-deoxyribosyltransferase
MKKVYIAGPINGVSFDEARDRNEALAKLLRSAGFEPLDPLDPVKLADHSALSGQVGDLDRKAAAAGISPEMIVHGCLKMVDDCDVVLANCLGVKTAGVPMVGTPMEIMYAWLKGKQILVVNDDLTSAWFDVLTTQCSSIEAAIKEIIDRGELDKQVLMVA